MANIFNIDISYITETEVKDTTNKAELKAMDDKDVKILIAKAESIVNNYIGYIFYDITTESEKVQQDIKIATFYITEQIFVNNDLVKKVNINGVVNSESSGDRSVSFETTSKTNDLKILGINEFAKKILDNYKKIFFKQVI